MSDSSARSFPRQALPDLLAFTAGLAMAWFFGWRTADLVWSLWLSSLAVGYATIVWTITSGALARKRQRLAAGAGILGGAVFLLSFFTVHFGMFHFVHSVFLNTFFPITPGERGPPGFGGYLEVVLNYWPFLIVALVAERGAFARAGAAASGDSGNAMMGPYQNVVRLHLLIFFFGFAHLAGLDGFLVYGTVYAVYFFPWRIWKGRKHRPVQPA